MGRLSLIVVGLRSDGSDDSFFFRRSKCDVFQGMRGGGGGGGGGGGARLECTRRAGIATGGRGQKGGRAG
jgi:hypothetical protein